MGVVFAGGSSNESRPGHWRGHGGYGWPDGRNGRGHYASVPLTAPPGPKNPRFGKCCTAARSQRDRQETQRGSSEEEAPGTFHALSPVFLPLGRARPSWPSSSGIIHTATPRWG